MNFKQSLLVVLCIVICGCPRLGPECDDSRSYPYWTEWSDGKLISIVDDSIAVLSIQQYKIECRDALGSKEEEEVSSKNGLFLVNYREKQKPLLGSILNYKLNSEIFRIARGYYMDSSVLVFDEKIEGRDFGFWKIGTESIKLSKNKKLDGHIFYTGRPYVFHWIDGNILFNDYRRQWIVFDTKAGSLEVLDLSGEYEWLSGCYEISYIGNKIVCIRDNFTADYLELVVNGNATDTSYYLQKGITTGDLRGWFGNYVIRQENDDMSKVYKIDTENFKFSTSFIPVWINKSYEYEDGVKFYKDNKNLDDFIYYTSQDLLF